MGDGRHDEIPPFFQLNIFIYFFSQLVSDITMDLKFWNQFPKSIWCTNSAKK